MTDASAARGPGAAACLLSLLALAAAWGAWGLRDVFTAGWAGFATDGRQRVLSVESGGAAERAGLAAGDEIIAIDGRPVDGSSLSRLDARPGETRLLSVRTGAGQHDLRITYQAPDSARLIAPLARYLAGLGCLGVSALAWWRRPSRLAAWFALTGLGLGLALMNPPALAPGGLRWGLVLLRNAVVLAGVGAGLLVLWRVTDPARPAWSLARWVAVSLPLILFWLLLLARSTLSGFPGILRFGIDLFGALVLVCYLAVALVRLIRAGIRSRWRQEPANPRQLALVTLAALAVPAAGSVWRVVDAPGYPVLLDLGILALVPLMGFWARAVAGHPPEPGASTPSER